MINGMRFIIGNRCNYNCFYCHHEGVFNEKVDENYADKIDKIFKYCDNNNINSLSVTGGEPLLYINKLKYILNKFNDAKFKFSINTNAILISKYIDYFESLNCRIEFHINVSSLNQNVHEFISGSKLYNTLMQNLQLLKNSKHKVCFNTILLKDVNDSEVYKFLEFCKENNFTLRLLQYLPSNQDDKKYVITDRDLPKYIHGIKVGEINSYGIYPCWLDEYYFEFVKNLCCEKLCERCKEQTYVQFTPEMNVKMCMMKDDVINIDYSDYDKMCNVFDKL